MMCPKFVEDFEMSSSSNVCRKFFLRFPKSAIRFVVNGGPRAHLQLSRMTGGEAKNHI